ncbi:MAG: ribbon-helix-helix domain-containing protein [candidate division NC10 bacterium]|nr:ribbon-helix-helix domain-containing protein [candidate division NC10 bacterium]
MKVGFLVWAHQAETLTRLREATRIPKNDLVREALDLLFAKYQEVLEAKGERGKARKR